MRDERATAESKMRKISVLVSRYFQIYAQWENILRSWNNYSEFFINEHLQLRDVLFFFVSGVKTAYSLRKPENPEYSWYFSIACKCTENV